MGEQEGRALLQEALTHVAKPGATVGRLAVLQNPADVVKPASLLSKLVEAALRLPSRRSKIPDFLLSLLADPQDPSGCANSSPPLRD